MDEVIIYSNVIELLNSLNEKEIDRFSAFINSDYMNTDPKVRVLLKKLIGSIVGKQSYTKNMQLNLFKVVFPLKKTNGSALDKSQVMLLNVKMSLLYKRAKHFICIEQLSKEPACEAELLYKALSSKKQYKLIERELNKDRKVIENISERSIDFHNYAFKIEEHLLQYYHKNNMILEQDNIKDLSDCLDIRYMLEKLRLELTVLSLSRVSAAKNYDLKTTQILAGLKEQKHCSENPLIRIYEITNLLMESDNSEIFHELLEELDRYYAVISKSSISDFYVVALNFCAQQIRKGRLEYNRIMFDLYKLLDERNLLLEGDHLPLSKLKNIVGVSCLVGEFDWASGIIEKYRSFLSKEFRESACYFYFGVIAFYKKDFKGAISQLIRADKINSSYDVNCRMLLLKSHYELDQDYDERTMQIFRTADQFIRKNKSLSAPRKKAYKSFINLLINLYRTRHRAGKKTVHDMKEKLLNVDFVTDKKWLLEKLEELSKRRRR